MIAAVLKFFSPIANYWQAIITFIVTALVAFGLHSLDINAIKDSQQKSLADQAAQLNAQCRAGKIITEQVDNVLQKKNNLTIGNYDASISVLNKQSCQSTAPSASGVNHGASDDTRLYYTNPQAARAILDRFKQAEINTNKLLACQSFIKKTWKEQNQPIDQQ